MGTSSSAEQSGHFHKRSHMQRTVHTGGDRAGSIFRLYMGGLAIVTWFMAMTEPRSMSSLAAASGAGEILAWLLMVIGSAAVVDALVNDFLPQRFHWRVAVRQRHFILAAMAFCYTAQLYVAFSSMRSTGLLLYYLWNAVSITFIQFVDAHQRSKDATCVITCG